MNYRHEFHAGNFADVLKHVFLIRVLLYLRRKDTPFRFIDTHAGSGLYDLDGPDAQRSNEARDGILRLLERSDLAAASDWLQPYLDVVRAAGAPKFYPGSPLIAKSLLRKQDKALFCEMLPQSAKSLRVSLARDARTKVIEIDGYQGLNAFLPPPERRGLVLIDPPYERRDEFERIFASLGEALRKFPGGIFMIWLPIKEREVVEAFCKAVASLAPKLLRVDLRVEKTLQVGQLAHTGLLVVNPPFGLAEDAKAYMPILTQLLARGEGAQCSVEHVEREASTGANGA